MIMSQATSIQSKSRQQGAVGYSEHTLKERRSNGKKATSVKHRKLKTLPSPDNKAETSQYPIHGSSLTCGAALRQQCRTHIAH